MSQVTFEDLSLKIIDFGALPRLKKLQRLHFDTQPEVCIELPLLMTQYMKQVDDSSGSSELRAAKRLKYILEKKEAIINEDDLLAGTTTTRTKGVVIYPQFMAQALWPELDTLTSRAKNPYHITQEEIDTLDMEIFPYWMDRTVQEVCRKDYNNPLCLRMTERLFFYLATKAHVISHTVPGYDIVVNEGLASIIDKAQQRSLSLSVSETDSEKKDFLKAVITVLEGVMAYAEKLSQKAASLAENQNDPDRKDELIRIHNTCRKVPKEKPTTFFEALQAIWICHVALHQENNNIAISLGCLDQILYPLYRKGIEEHTLTPKEAVELVGCFFLKLGDHVPMSPETAEELFGGSGSNQAITLGGVDESGNDAVSDLTYVMLRATELLKVRDPNVNIRYSPEIHSKDYLRRLCEVNVTTKATPCFHNDTEVIRALTAQGYSLEDARNYSIVGCVEPVRGGKTFGHTGAILVNLTSALELSLFQGKHRLTEEEQFGPITPAVSEMDSKSFDEYLSVFKQQLIFLIDKSVETNNMLGRTHLKIHPLPLLSALFQGPLEKAKDVLEGGAVYNTSGVAIIGFSEVVDSLLVIKELVYEKKQITFPKLIEAIEKNWEGYDKLRQKVINSKTKFGTNSSEAALMAKLLIDVLHEEYQKRKNYKGGNYTVGYWTMTTHAGWGALTGALPSGRKKGEVLPSGMTPVSGQAPELLDVLKFVANLDATKIANGHALNLKYTPEDDSKQMISNFAARIEAYMKMGGLQVQCNIMDRASLEEARKHPEQHQNLLVRVSGYTAYFTDLSSYMQDEIIKRAEYNLQTGTEV
ncbi:MAG: formate acetyltransferase [Proteobacteria bacterium]|nr:formate acetyltransferase [Pseudomonadota bacterium]